MYQTILLAYDGTRAGRVVLREGAELAARCGAAVHLLAVLQPSPGILFAEGTQPSGLLEDAQGHYEQVLEEGLQRLRARGLEAEATLRRGDPAEEILAVARATGAELIVLGHRRRNAMSRWWRAAVDEAILADAPCSLLVAVAREESAAD